MQPATWAGCHSPPWVTLKFFVPNASGCCTPAPSSVGVIWFVWPMALEPHPSGRLFVVVIPHQPDLPLLAILGKTTFGARRSGGARWNVIALILAPATRYQ